MKYMKKAVLFFLFIFIAAKMFSANNELKIEGYGAALEKGSNLTHWMYSGKNGVYNKFDEKAGAFIEVNGELKKIEYGSNLKLSNSDKEDSIEIKEIYLRKKWKNYIAILGKKGYEKANEKSELSTGSLLISNNAESPFRIHFGTKGYIPVWKTNGKLLLNASMSNSVLEKERNCKSPYLHEKEGYLKLKLGKERFVYGGVSHIALWGGELNGEKINSDFMDFISVLIIDNKGHNELENEVINKIGDHKGIYEIGYIDKMGEKDFKLYFQHFFEDRDGMKLNSIQDMLLGINIKNDNGKFFKEMLLEYIHTKYQGGTGTHLENGGQDYYYDNYLYGPWTYKDMILGNSLVVTDGSGENIKVVHSRIRAFHTGISGNLSSKLKYKTMLTYSENYGTCADKGKDFFTDGKKQWYTYFEIEKENLFSNPRLNGKIGFGYDDGEIYSRTGTIASLEYKF